MKDNHPHEERSKFLAEDEQDTQLEDNFPQVRKRRTCNSTIQHLAFTIIILLLTIDILIHLLATTTTCPSRSPYLTRNGTTHELASALPHMTYSPQNLTGLWTYSPSTNRLTLANDSPTALTTGGTYFGPPSPLLDQSWSQLLNHTLSTLLPSEIHPHMHLHDKDRWATDQRFHFEPEVFHVLHCLNAVRVHLNRLLYPSSPTGGIPSQEILEQEKAELADVVGEGNWQRLHLEHCMDRIRQDVMCHADMTPSVFYGLDGLPVPLTLGKPGERVCRDWSGVRGWVEERRVVEEGGLAEGDGGGGEGTR